MRKVDRFSLEVWVKEVVGCTFFPSSSFFPQEIVTSYDYDTFSDALNSDSVEGLSF